jgi:hypothetical protein
VDINSVELAPLIGLSGFAIVMVSVLLWLHRRDRKNAERERQRDPR